MHVGTWNAGPGTNRQVLRDLLALLRQVDVLCVQEFGDRKSLVWALRARGFRVHNGDGRPGAAKDCVIWKRGKGRVHKQTVKVGDATYVGHDGGAGPTTLDNKYINAVTFLRTGVTVASTHVVPSVYLKDRAELARKHLLAAAAWLKQQERPVFLCGDLNMEPHNRLLDPLRRAGAWCNHDTLGWVPTHGARSIDYVWALGAKLHWQTTVENSSDHRAVIVRA